VVAGRRVSRFMMGGLMMARLVKARQRMGRLVVARVLRSALELPGELEARRPMVRRMLMVGHMFVVRRTVVSRL
jgi:hypothetical protein